jgi:hypothetical protein
MAPFVWLWIYCIFIFITCSLISRQPSPKQVVIHKKQLKNVEYLNYGGSLITNDARCTEEIKSNIATAKEAFNKKQTTLFTSKLDLI